MEEAIWETSELALKGNEYLSPMLLAGMWTQYLGLLQQF